MRASFYLTLKNRLQKIFWVDVTSNFIVKSISDLKPIDPVIKCGLIPITLNNCQNVADFREENRISQYKEKVASGEIGYFAEHKGKMVGSIWATINRENTLKLVRRYMELMPREALIHDIVTDSRMRGMGVGPLMVEKICPILLSEYGVSRIIIDVSIKNKPSLRMMNKIGLRADHTKLYISSFGRLLFQKILRKYS